MYVIIYKDPYKQTKPQGPAKILKVYKDNLDIDIKRCKIKWLKHNKIQDVFVNFGVSENLSKRIKKEISHERT